MKKFAGIIAIAGLLALTGCGGNDTSDVEEEKQEEHYNDVYVKEITLKDGTVVECAVMEGYRQGGVDCNW